MAKTQIVQKYVNAVNIYLGTVDSDLDNLLTPGYSNKYWGPLERSRDAYHNRLDDILTHQKFKILDKNLPNVLYQADLKFLLFQASPRMFNYIITHDYEFRPAITQEYRSFTIPLDDVKVRHRNTGSLLNNTIMAIKYGIPISYDTMYDVISILSGIEHGHFDWMVQITAHPKINVATFRYLMDYYLDIAPNSDLFRPNIGTYISSALCDFLEIILPHYTLPFNDAVVRDKLYFAILNGRSVPNIITTILLLEQYGVTVLDDSESGQKLLKEMKATRGFKPYLENDQQALKAYYPAGYKRTIYTAELIRKTPGNYMHLLPNELAKEIYSHLY